MVESGGEPAPSWTLGVDGHGTVLAFSWLPRPLDEIKSRRDGPRTGNRHFILKKVKFYSRSRKKVTVLNLFYIEYEVRVAHRAKQPSDRITLRHY